jgi:hypothetical protein
MARTLHLRKGKRGKRVKKGTRRNTLHLNDSEKVLFTGTYNINDQVNNGITYTLLPVIDINKNGYNPFIGNYYNITDKSHSSHNLLLEYNNISSYLSDLKTKIGQIQFTGLDINKTTNNVASVKLREFDVNSCSGIYANVSKVIIDNRKTKRVILFIGKK